MRARQRLERRPPSPARRARPTPLRGVHGRPPRDPLQPAVGRFLQVPPQAGQGGPRGRHVQARHPRRRPPPREPPVANLRAPKEVPA